MTVAQLFAFPDVIQMTAAFACFFGLVFGPAGVAHLVGRVSGMFDDKTTEEL
jgi:hypothetical protein